MATRRFEFAHVDGNVLGGNDPQMKSPPPAPVDRIERTVNPVALAILLVCLAGALLALWLAPSAIGATLMTWMIVILAVCGAFGLLLYAFGLLQLPTTAARFDTTKAIADSNPDGILVTDRESQIVYANDAYRALSGAPAASELRPVERLFTGSPDVSESVYRLSQAAKSGVARERGASSLAAAERRGRGRLVPHSRSPARGRRQRRPDGVDGLG